MQNVSGDLNRERFTGALPGITPMTSPQIQTLWAECYGSPMVRKTRIREMATPVWLLTAGARIAVALGQSFPLCNAKATVCLRNETYLSALLAIPVERFEFFQNE